MVVKLTPLDREQPLEIAIPKHLAIRLVTLLVPTAELTILAAVPKETALGTLHQLGRLLAACVAGSHPVGEGSVSLDSVAELHHVVEGNREDLQKN